MQLETKITWCVPTLSFGRQAKLNFDSSRHLDELHIQKLMQINTLLVFGGLIQIQSNLYITVTLGT